MKPPYAIGSVPSLSGHAVAYRWRTLTLIAMQGHQQKGRQNNTSSNNKDKYNTIIETRTGEDHDDENLHNPETVQDAVIHLEVDEEQ